MVPVFSQRSVSPRVELALRHAWMRMRHQERATVPLPNGARGLPPAGDFNTAERRARVYEMTDAGKSSAEIAAVLGVKQSLVCNDLSRREQASNGERRRASRDWAKQTVREVFEAGGTLHDMAKASGRTYDTVRNYCAEMGLKIRERDTAIRRGKVKALHDEGRNVRDIADAMGMSWGGVANDLKALGLRE